MIIPREGDKIRVYIQLSDTDAVDPATGRIDLGRYGPERLLEVAKKTFRPYTIDAVPDKIEWWTIYQSRCPLFAVLKPTANGLNLISPPTSRAASGLEIHRKRAGFHCWRRLPHTFSESRAGYECQHE
jgi:hypothetical protein